MGEGIWNTFVYMYVVILELWHKIYNSVTDTKPWINGDKDCTNFFALLKHPLHPWFFELPGTTICCQNAPMAIHHKDIMHYRNSYIYLLWTFLWELFYLFSKYFEENQSLCILTLLRYMVTFNCTLKIISGSFGIAPGSCQIPVNQVQFSNFMQIDTGSSQLISRLVCHMSHVAENKGSVSRYTCIILHKIGRRLLFKQSYRRWICQTSAVLPLSSYVAILAQCVCKLAQKTVRIMMKRHFSWSFSHF